MKNSAVAACIFVLFSCLFIGCQRYGNVDENTYKFASSLYSICNLKNEERLEVFGNNLSNEHKLPANEKQWLLDIVAMAENRQWEKASKKARQLLEEQITHK